MVTLRLGLLHGRDISVPNLESRLWSQTQFAGAPAWNSNRLFPLLLGKMALFVAFATASRPRPFRFLAPFVSVSAKNSGFAQYSNPPEA